MKDSRSGEVRDAERGLATIGLPPIDRGGAAKPLVLWVVQGLLLVNAGVTLWWLMRKLLAGEAPRPAVFALALAFIVGCLALLVAVQRRARGAHAAACVGAAGLGIVEAARHFRGSTPRHVLEGLELGAMHDAQAAHFTASLLWAALALWIGLSGSARRYFAAAGVHPVVK